VADIRAVLRTQQQGENTVYTSEILGKAAALQALSAWTRSALSVFGAMPTDGEILERYVLRELR
jgi:hypothetical protein